ncbi:MAG: hypothetical protein ACODAD_10345, partial [Planctomycetota bacterium]
MDCFHMGIQEGRALASLPFRYLLAVFRSVPVPMSLQSVSRPEPALEEYALRIRRPTRAHGRLASSQLRDRPRGFSSVPPPRDNRA